ncbi:hypothetical protein NXY26_01045 [Parabacteroides distasonis]|nr:hypothetical protein NXY26_01045 [Parabacteroides distasonis]
MKYIRSKVKKFIIPLITWSVISLPFVYCKDYLLTNINTGVKWLEPFTFVLPLGCLRSNDALWFLSSLFLVNVIFFIVNRRLSGKRLFVFILLCYLYSFVDSKYSHVFLIVRMLAWVLSIFMGDICFVKLQ